MLWHVDTQSNGRYDIRANSVTHYNENMQCGNRGRGEDISRESKRRREKIIEVGVGVERREKREREKESRSSYQTALKRQGIHY